MGPIRSLCWSHARGELDLGMPAPKKFPKKISEIFRHQVQSRNAADLPGPDVRLCPTLGMMGTTSKSAL